jgi:hypothetical protein
MGTNTRTDGQIFTQYSGISSHSMGARIHTAVVPKPFLIDANINSAITAMLDIVQPKNDDVDEDATYDKVLPHENYVRNWSIILVSR